MVGSRCLVAGAVFAVLANALPAAAQDFPPVANRDYALDLYSGGAFGSNEMVSMGGAAVAIARGSAGMTVNPAAPAVRHATSKRYWDWDAHIDWLNPGIGTDFDNNGIATDEDLDLLPFFTLGAVLQFGKWGIGLTLTNSQFRTDRPGQAPLDQSLSALQFHVARTFFGGQIAAGVGFKVGNFAIDQDDERLFALNGTAIEGGAVWMPKNRNLRLGAAASLPASGTTIQNESCDPNDCAGLVLPSRVEVPWSVSAGVGLRLAPTPWNRRVPTRFLDERYLIVAADIKLTGSVPDGHGIEAFSLGQLQPSGRAMALSVRAGLEYEWLPGRLRVRTGSYWEPSRFRDPSGGDVGGRAHVTAGGDLRFWQFRVFSRDYRLRLSLTADLADKYFNGGLSVGFWH